jgi:hypothetical protein
MAKVKSANLQKLKSKKSKKEEHLHLSMGSGNYGIIGLGIVVIILGYIIMGADRSVDGFMGTVLSPILLIIGYCVIVPVGILYGSSFMKRGPVVTSEEEVEIEIEEADSSNVKSSGNIKTS